MTGFQLKLVALVFMFFNHLVIFVPHFVPFLNPLFLVLGSVSFPVFVYLSVQAYIHTHDRLLYLIRLYLASFVMAVGSAFLSSFLHSDAITQNIFFTIAVNVSLIAVLHWAFKESGARVLLGLIFFAFFAFMGLVVEGGFLMSYLFLIFFLFRKRKNILLFAYAFFCVLLCLVPVFGLRWILIMAFPFVYFYNGQKGIGTKYLFYVFYPLHIWFLYSVSLLYK